MNVKKFHQFVVLEKGPVNTAIINFLTGDLYQVENHLVEKLDDGRYDEIPHFLDFLEKEELIFEVEQDDWIPTIHFDEPKEDVDFQLEIEEGVDLGLLYEQFNGFKVSSVIYSGKSLPDVLPDFPGYVRQDGDFAYCRQLTSIDGHFKKITEVFYTFNKYFNSCWGRKIAVTRDGKIRPCIFSRIIIGDLSNDNIGDIVEKAKEYRTITKDKVERCKDCELRYACFDCRVLASESNGNLFAVNPLCKYDPYKGTWEKDNNGAKEKNLENTIF